MFDMFYASEREVIFKTLKLLAAQQALILGDLINLDPEFQRIELSPEDALQIITNLQELNAILNKATAIYEDAPDEE
jgi:hypothetical protein